MLFRLKVNKDKTLTMQLCIPEKYIPALLYQYHDNIMAGHQGIQRTVLTLEERYYFPSMFDYVRKYLLCCQECQSRREKDADKAAYFPRIPLSFRPMSRISADIKYMPPSHLGFNYILLCTCEISNYVIGIPLEKRDASCIAEALMNKVVYTHGAPRTLIIDEDRALTSMVMQELYKRLKVRSITVSPLNHGSNRTERYIRTLNNMLCKYLTATGSEWPLYVYPACYAMNTFVSPSLNYSPYELVFTCKPAPLDEFQFEPDIEQVNLPANEYLTLMKKRHALMMSLVVERKTREQQLQVVREKRNYPNHKDFAVGDLVYLFAPGSSDLKTASRKLSKNWIGPLKVKKVLDETHYLIGDWKDQLIPIQVHINRLKPYYVHFGQIEHGKLKVVNNLPDLLDHIDKLTRQNK